MEILDNIIIKNIRRFGSDVNIEIGKGATIFYAPNGTGKTSIFEAIELALTGNVKRLGNNFKPLMRDKCTKSSVRLNFTSGNFCQANLENGIQPVLTGNHSDLFGKTPLENVPFLLRLTHLLNQSADGWFVQSQTSSAAGAQLGYLSIGREAIQAKNIITGTKRAATSFKEDNQKALDIAKIEFKQWFELLNKRDASIHLEPSRPLIPYEELFASINEIAKALDYNKLSYKGNIQLIKNQHSEVSTIVLQKNDEASSKLIKLDALKPMVTEYAKSNAQSAEYRRNNTALAEERRAIEHALEKFNIDLLSEEKKLAIYTTSYKNSQVNLDRLQRAVESKSIIFDLTVQIDSYTAQIDKFTKVYNSAKDAYLSDLEIISKHDLLFKREVAIAEKKSLLDSREQAVSRWRDYNKNIAQLVNELRPNFALDYDSNNEIIKSLTDQRNECLLAVSEAKKAFEAINTANDAIIGAVGVITSSLSPQAGTCPVCTQQYEAAELHRRMSAALDAISPELQNASSRTDEARRKLREVDKKIFTANNKLTKSFELLNGLDNNVADLRRELSHLINNNFPGINSVDIADEQCRRAKEENELALQELQYQKSLLPAAPTSENLAIIRNSMDNLGYGLSNIAERRRLLERECNKALNDSNDETADPSMEELEEMFKAVDSELSNIKNAELTIEVLRKDISQQIRLLENINSKSSSLTKQLVEINSNLNQYQTQWSLLKLSQEPSEYLLLREISILQDFITHIEASSKRLEQLEIEISRWFSLVEHSTIEKSINTMRGVLPESEYTSLLSEKVKYLEKEKKNIQTKVTTLNTFSTNLGDEIKGINKIITSINPLWNSLLKRIVIDPRFSETILKSYGSHNKQHADVNVSLHGENILAHHVASEAQITDLQLTFLLALAQNYEWTPWRALLLDDPTQHHDLVHASAVFDLLRDYIAEKHFQVLLSTHDYVQAKFFLRKLQNDGIPAKICTLQATSAGVVPVYKDR